MEIIWSEEAKKTFKNNVNYLKKHWSKKEVDNFVLEALRTIEIIKTMPHIGRYDDYFQCNILVVVEQISLFYDIEKGKIILLTFWDNRQKPIQLLR
jgi:plasmid stabilization system protein ParE